MRRARARGFAAASANMRITMPLLALVVAIFLVASQAIYTVDQTKYAIKFQLGEIIEVDNNAGLYFKVPLVQNVRYFDRRNLTLTNTDVDRVVTSEKTPLEVDFVVLWRIIDVKQYYVAVQGNEEFALRRLAQTVRSNLAEEFNKSTMHEAISTGRDRITSETRIKADQDARLIGVEVVDVRLRRLALPQDVTGPVYLRMESERRRVANELRSTGAAESEKIRADADRQRQVILADAYRQAQKIKGEGDAKASAIYAAAYGQNPEFYTFYRSLEAYKATFRGRNDVMVLDPSGEFFQYFKQSGAGRARVPIK
jgi:membrane protease subunit HflC